MTDLLEKAMEALRKLPDDAQDAYAIALLDALGADGDVCQLTDDDRRAIENSKEQARRGEFVADDEMVAFWRKLGA